MLGDLDTRLGAAMDAITNDDKQGNKDSCSVELHVFIIALWILVLILKHILNKKLITFYSLIKLYNHSAVPSLIETCVHGARVDMTLQLMQNILFFLRDQQKHKNEAH